MAGLSPTQRTLRALKGEGRLCGIVERYIQAPGMKFGFRKDLFGIIDIIALDSLHGIVGIQSTGTDFQGHMRKMTDNEETYSDTGMTRVEASLEWLQAGGRLELWGWRKLLKKRGGKLKVWTPRIHIFKEEDFE